MTDSSLERDLQRLKEAYGRKLPGKLAQLDALLQEAWADPDQKQVENAYRLAHQLKGTAGSYGFSELGEEMRRIEEALTGIAKGSTPDLVTVRKEIESALGRAQAQLASRA